MQDEEPLEDDFRLNRPIIGSIVLLLLAVFSGFCLQSLKKDQAQISIDTIFVNQPELGIEKARFYLVRNWLGYGLVQFKDVNDDKNLDRVFYSALEIPFSPDAFNPNTGFPGEDLQISDPNSPDWNEWLKKFDLVLKEHAKKLKRQKRFN